MRKMTSLLVALTLPAVPVVLLATPAHAAGSTICVGSPAKTACDSTKPTIQDAITAANANGIPDVIVVGPGTYSDGPYVLNGDPHGITLKGSGPSTILTLPDGPKQTYVTATAATVSDLTIKMDGATSTNDLGLDAAQSSTISDITIDGTTATFAKGLNVLGSTVSHSTVTFTGATNLGMNGGGLSVLSDSSITADVPYTKSGGGTDTITRDILTSTAGNVVTFDNGEVDIDDSLLDLGASHGAAIFAGNKNNGVPAMTLKADHITIVGGSSGSHGVQAYAASLGAKQSSTATVTNSIIWGPAIPLEVDAKNDGTQGGSSSASISASFTDFNPAADVSNVDATTGTGGITQGGGNLNTNPAFVSATDRHLSGASLLIDAGDPAAGGPTADLDGHDRVVDGDGNGSAVSDLGSYEAGDTLAPETTINDWPNDPTNDKTPSFGFTSEPGATFACQIDNGPWNSCTSPFTAPAQADGTHTFRVKASDAAMNTDATPDAHTFTVDTVAPAVKLGVVPAARTRDTTPTFAFTSEPGATFECRVDSGPVKPCASPFTTAVLPNGSHTFRVWAVDTAHNQTAVAATRTVVVDTKAPNTKLALKPAKAVHTKKVRFKVASTEAGSKFQCRLDAGAWKTCTASKAFVVAKGHHVVRIRAVDAAGNVDKTPVVYRFTRK